MVMPAKPTGMEMTVDVETVSSGEIEAVLQRMLKGRATFDDFLTIDKSRSASDENVGNLIALIALKRFLEGFGMDQRRFSEALKKEDAEFVAAFLKLSPEERGYLRSIGIGNSILES